MKKQLFIIVMFVIVITFMGCAGSSYKVSTQYDEFENLRVYRLENNKLGKKGLGASLARSVLKSSFGSTEFDIYFNPMKYIHNDNVSYQLEIIYKSEQPLNVGMQYGKETLVLLVDGERMGFTKIGGPSGGDVNQDGLKISYEEKMNYPITPEELKTIAFAKEVKVKLSGGSQYAQTVFDEDNFSNLKRFYNEYVKGD